MTKIMWIAGGYLIESNFLTSNWKLIFAEQNKIVPMVHSFHVPSGIKLAYAKK